jgi:hypothetical protein
MTGTSGGWGVDPKLGIALAVLAGVLILSQAALSWSATAGSLAGFGFIIGAVLVASALSVRSSSRHRREAGALVFILALVSFFTVNGYWIGSLLGATGGVLIMTSWGPTFFSRSSSMFRTDSLGPPCPHCGRHIPIWTGRCPYCGYPE